VRNQQKPFFAKRKYPIEVIAHRGGGGEWPGETLYAFEQALKAGVDILEMDVHRTRDGVLVLMHDQTLDATTNGTGLIKEKDWDEIKDLDAAYTWPMHRGKGIKIPRLEEVFDAFPKVRMNIEVKQKSPSLVPDLCELIIEKGKKEEVLIASGWHRSVREVRSECRELKLATSASVWEILNFQVFDNVLGVRTRPPTDAIQWHSKFAFHVITERFVAAARKVNLQVHAWTVNEHEEMNRMIALGVDGIITDYPTKLLSLLGRLQSVIPPTTRGLP
jgi:glycerophosphoryl diester phosphodiesterase